MVGWWRPPALLRVVIVNMKHESEALRGVLWASRGPWLQLREVTLLRPNAEPQPVDGEVIVHRDNVAFIQVVP